MIQNSDSKTCRVNTDLDLAEQQCSENGKRLTIKRKQILSVLLTLNKAASAYDILNCYQQTYGEALPAMSIYRILEFLEQEHFVHKLLLANKYVACSQINCAKTHEASQFYICSRCGKVKEVAINSEAFEELKRDSVEAGFDIDAPQLEINCVCTECC